MTDLQVNWLSLRLPLKIIVLHIKTFIATLSILIYEQIFKSSYHVRYIVIDTLIIQLCSSLFWRQSKSIAYL